MFYRKERRIRELERQLEHWVAQNHRLSASLVEAWETIWLGKQKTNKTKCRGAK